MIYLSSDRDQADFDACLAQLGCCAIPYEERQAAADIATLYDIQCKPTLLLLGPRKVNCHAGDRPLLNRHVRDLFWQNGANAASLVGAFPFCPRPYGDLNQISDSIHETKCVVMLCEACDDEEQEECKTAVQMAAEAYNKQACTPLRFYWACEPTALTQTLRDALRLGPPREADLILLDFPCDASYYVSPFLHDINAESVLAFARAPGKVRTLC